MSDTRARSFLADPGAAKVGTDAIGTFGAIHTFILVLATFAIQVVPCLEGGSGVDSIPSFCWSDVSVLLGIHMVFLSSLRDLEFLSHPPQ